MFTKLYVKTVNAWENVTRKVQNERGAQALEWIALGMLVLAIMAAIATAFKGDTSVGTAVKNQLIKLINGIGG
ncbi:hypothetical protein [Fictibacillus sp. BK138]|uniref:hypothetical protein n=1 Tax=Fictibacillus sp. BK138 TaxID=2512121 RepID=UPI001028F62A|nr:hypothetical protein [Fictibacillus sp. BK138]RZT13018.1 hypothetical protein EV282_4057 [Fictibacillus sp. BK138]